MTASGLWYICLRLELVTYTMILQHVSFPCPRSTYKLSFNIKDSLQAEQLHVSKIVFQASCYSYNLNVMQNEHVVWFNCVVYFIICHFHYTCPHLLKCAFTQNSVLIYVQSARMYTERAVLPNQIYIFML